MISSKDKRGFTLIELLIVMLITLIVMSGVYSTYMVQQKSYSIQEQVAEMQQNLRIGMYMIEQDFRMAGFSTDMTSSLGVVSATNTSFEFDRVDMNGNTVRIAYFINPASSLGANTLSRSIDNLTLGGDITDPIATNIEVFDLQFYDANNVFLDPGADVNWATSGIDDIRAVEITLVARVAKVDPDYECLDSFTNMRGDQVMAPTKDKYRRRGFSKHIKCRNLGIP